MVNLNDLLSKSESDLKKDPRVQEAHQRATRFSELYITREAYDTAHAYARLACSMAKRSIECGGYLIQPKDAKDRIATRAYLASDQIVDGGEITIQGEDVIKAGREVDAMGYRVLGWWHSHGTTNTFHSPVDKRNQMTVLNCLAAVNYIIEHHHKEMKNLEVRVEENKTVVMDKENPKIRYEFEGRSMAEMNPEKMRIVEEKKVGFAYSFVVTTSLLQPAPYAEIATRESCGECDTVVDESKVVPIRVFGEEKPIDELALRKELREKVRVRPLYRPRRRKGRKGFSIFSPSTWMGEYYTNDDLELGIRGQGQPSQYAHYPRSYEYVTVPVKPKNSQYDPEKLKKALGPVSAPSQTDLSKKVKEILEKKKAPAKEAPKEKSDEPEVRHDGQ